MASGSLTWLQKKLIALKLTHRALAQNPPPHWQPEEEEKPIGDHQRNLI
jgi:hypothetical protein